MVISKRFVEVDDVFFGKWNDGKWYIFIKKNVFDEMFKFYIFLLFGVIDDFSLIKFFLVVLLIFWYGYVWFGCNYRGKNK